MARVCFSSAQQQLTGVAECDIAAADYRQLLGAIAQRFPRLDMAELQKMAIAIDGEIIHEPLLESLTEHSEVHFLHFIAGG
jgi:hypothetical protein